jgi:hypothetical protein
MKRMSCLSVRFLIACAFSSSVLVISSSKAASEYTGRLGDERSQTFGDFYVDGFSLAVKSGQDRIVVELTSLEFDTYLVVVPPEGEPLINDDHGSANRSLLIIQAKYAGIWKILVTSYGRRSGGQYLLTVQSPLDRSVELTREQPIELNQPLLARILDRQASGRGLGSVAGSTTGSTSSGPSSSAESSYPLFPWPPPHASATATVSSELLQRQGKRITYLKDIDALLETVLRANGYFERSYYSVPDGFAMVTKLEQINADGTPKDDPAARWSIEIPPLNTFSLSHYLTALFKSAPGHFRTIVFIVTSQPFAQSDEQVKRSTALRWLHKGLNVLPDSVGSQPYTDGHRVTVLVYEFEKLKGARDAGIAVPGRLDATRHLQSSGILRALER